MEVATLTGTNSGPWAGAAADRAAGLAPGPDPVPVGPRHGAVLRGADLVRPGRDRRGVAWPFDGDGPTFPGRPPESASRSMPRFVQAPASQLDEPATRAPQLSDAVAARRCWRRARSPEPGHPRLDAVGSPRRPRRIPDLPAVRAARDLNLAVVGGILAVRRRGNSMAGVRLVGGLFGGDRHRRTIYARSDAVSAAGCVVVPVGGAERGPAATPASWWSSCRSSSPGTGRPRWRIFVVGASSRTIGRSCRDGRRTARQLDGLVDPSSAGTGGDGRRPERDRATSRRCSRSRRGRRRGLGYAVAWDERSR